MENWQSFEQVVMEPLYVCMQRTKSLDVDMSPLTKTGSKWIDYIAKHKIQVIKFLEENIGECLGELRLVDEFLDQTPKVQSRKETIVRSLNWNWLKPKAAALWKILLRKWKDKQIGSKYLQNIYLIKDLYPK